MCSPGNLRSYKNSTLFRVVFLWTACITSFGCLSATAQICPPNIDFESGTFSNWTCYTGSVAVAGSTNVITLSPSGGPVPNQHTMYSSAQGLTDYFGGFPVHCPNGSGHSIKLGNNSGGNRAEGISYEFTIPPNQNTYSIVYHYAVVFQDPSHQPYQQPRLEIEATNVTDNQLIYCSSFTFFPNGSPLPGFFLSPVQQDTTSVWCKNWSAVSINLNGKAGKTIKLFFKTADCTFNRHFGYAYIDVDSECSSEFVGATYCADDTTVSVTAPYGYQSYTWYNAGFTQVLGTAQTLNFTPPPPSGTPIAVEVIPYNGYGCPDTFYAIMLDTLKLRPYAGEDALSCNQNLVQLGANPKQGVTYRWSPVAGLSNANIANPRAGPLATTNYVLTVQSMGGGCVSNDTVLVTASVIDTTLTLLGKAAYCITSSDSAVLRVPPTLKITWYKNNNPIAGASGIRYKVTQSGDYYALLENDKGCIISTRPKTILIESPIPGVTYPVQNAVVNIPMPLQARPVGITALWKPTLFLSEPSSFNPDFSGTREQLYTVAITTASGCTAVDTQFVKVFPFINFYVPTAFTPNRDGRNDYLLPVATGIIEFRYFRVFNRWGQLLFELTPGSPGWDGTLKGLPQTTQTVVWMAEGIGADKKRHVQKGTSVLVR
jgi:gliding motility-associated-like protein